VVGSGTKLDGDTASLHLTKAADGSYALEDHATQAPEQGGAIATWNASGLWVEDVSGVWPEGITEFTSPTPALGADLTDVGAVYSFYRDHLHRKSLDGKGMAINSLIGVTDYGNPFVNAFWDSEGHKMVYGSGNDEYMPLSADLDVVGHEMTHGVVQNTANLLYLGQSGALNEAVADYFGNAIDVTVSGTPMSDPDASLIGGDLCRTLSPTKCALRDLDDARTTASFLSMPADQPHDEGGVHLNSTIFAPSAATGPR
jgi:Zn-dependent metalloprotease